MRKILRVEKSLKIFGEHLRNARLLRRLPQIVVADRAGISVKTLQKIESGDGGTSIANYAVVLFALGFDVPFSKLASLENDPMGQFLVELSLPQRARQKK